MVPSQGYCATLETAMGEYGTMAELGKHEAQEIKP
jgi:hypothetical protein